MKEEKIYSVPVPAEKWTQIQIPRDFFSFFREWSQFNRNWYLSRIDIHGHYSGGRAGPCRVDPEMRGYI